MDNRQQQMYARYNRMGYQYQNRNYGVTPSVDARRDHDDKEERYEKYIDKLPLAMAYVPMQRWENVCDAPSGLAQGTIFKDLVKPYCPLLKKRGDRS